MRPLEESEIQQVFEKLFKFVGKNLKNIVDRADQPHCFRLHKKVRRDSRSAPRSRPASLFPRWGKSTPHVVGSLVAIGVGDDEGNIRASDTP